MERNLWASIATLLALSAWSCAGAESIAVYRCQASDGTISLQDKPCADSERQELRTLPLPAAVAPVAKAAAPSTAIAAPTPAAAPTAPVEVRVTVVDPQPLYECRRHDGSTYASDTGVPERRWVPLWALGRDRGEQPSVFTSAGRPGDGLPAADGSAPVTHAGRGQVARAGAWVEDTCFRLPQHEACARRRVLLGELDRKRRLAFPSDRRTLDLQHQGLREQLQRECSGRR